MNGVCVYLHMEASVETQTPSRQLLLLPLRCGVEPSMCPMLSICLMLSFWAAP